MHAVYGNFPLMLALIALLTYVLLVRAFRSLLLPLKAVLLNLVSVGATLGLMVLFWQHGHGSKAIFGIDATGAITFWIPLMVFAFLYGLSMDYEVFILSRIREEYDAGRSTDAAVIEGIGRTGRLVTSAALILFLAFAALASGPGTDLKVLATGLGFGILLDATIVRSLLVPSLVSLFGRWNWYLPARFARPAARAAVPPASRGRAPGGDSGRLITAGLDVRCSIGATIAPVVLLKHVSLLPSYCSSRHMTEAVRRRNVLRELPGRRLQGWRPRDRVSAPNNVRVSVSQLNRQCVAPVRAIRWKLPPPCGPGRLRTPRSLCPERAGPTERCGHRAVLLVPALPRRPGRRRRTGLRPLRPGVG